MMGYRCLRIGQVLVKILGYLPKKRKFRPISALFQILIRFDVKIVGFFYLKNGNFDLFRLVFQSLGHTHFEFDFRQFEMSILNEVG